MLNRPFGPFLSLLAHSACSILSPISTPFYRLLDVATDDLIGTGPFVYNYYIADTEIDLIPFKEYWGSPTSSSHFFPFDYLSFQIIEDDEDRNYAMIAGSIDYLVDPLDFLFPAFKINPWITLHENQKPSVEYSYLCFNNQRINVTWRKAMSYAINYTYIIEEILNGTVIRANSPVSPAFMGHEPTVKAPDYNLTYSRELILSMGYGDISWNDTQWRSAEFGTFNYSFVFGQYRFHANLYELLRENMDLIGITILRDEYDLSWGWDPSAIPWFDNIDYLDLYWASWYPDFYNLPWQNYNIDFFDVYWAQWFPDYFDAITMLLPLFSNDSIANIAQVNNPWLQHKLETALQELNTTRRYEIYSEIQHYISEELFPHAFGFHPKIYTVHAANLYNIPYNPLDKFFAYPVMFNYTWMLDLLNS